MLRRGAVARAASPGVGIAPETTPVKYTPSMLNIQHTKWWDGKRLPYCATYRERSWMQKSATSPGFCKGQREVLTRRYSPAALRAALAMVPDGFAVADVPRPPQRIRAQSEGIVGRWYSNYWTLHSIKYQCLLAHVEWPFGERDTPRSNYDEPYAFVDFEETKAIRDYRSRWINVNRSLVGMSRRMKDAEEETRYLHYKKLQDTFWSSRKVLVTRVKAMHNQGTRLRPRDLPVPTLNIKAFMTDD